MKIKYLSLIALTGFLASCGDTSTPEKDIFNGTDAIADLTEITVTTQGVLDKGRAYLEQNKTKEGVVTLASGLQYKILVEGNGPKPTATSNVSTHYHGTLIDGTVFDSSVERGKPASFGVNQVIAGWTEALQLMNVGSKWELYIPSELAYGANPRPGGPIKPNMTLIFQVELLAIN